MKEWESMQPLMIRCFCLFDSEDTKLQLHRDFLHFSSLEKTYRMLIKKIVSTKNLGTMVEEVPDFHSSVIDLAAGLTKLVSDIVGWLDALRVGFPRLYFLSDDELLNIVTVAKDPDLIQKHLSK